MVKGPVAGVVGVGGREMAISRMRRVVSGSGSGAVRRWSMTRERSGSEPTRARGRRVSVVRGEL